MAATSKSNLGFLFVLAALGVRPRTPTLRIAGSATMRPLLAQLARKYQELHPEVTFDIVAGGSAAGLAEVRAQAAQIGMVSHALGAGEQDVYGIPIAREGLALAVHAGNAEALDEKTLRAILAGQARHWPASGQPVNLVGAAASASARLNAVAEDPAAIAYVSLAEAERRIGAGLPVRLLPAEGVAASLANLRRGDYRLQRPLNLVCASTPQGAVRSFLAFCLSAQVPPMLEACGFFPYLD